MYCFDFDGTLVEDNDSPVDRELLEILEAIRTHGAIWVVNTGRTLFQTIDGLTRHEFTSLPDFIIAKERELYRLGKFSRWHDFGPWNDQCRLDHRKFLRSHRRFFNIVRDFLQRNTHARFEEYPEEPPGIVADDEDEMDRICRFIDETAEDDPILDYQRNFVFLRFSHSRYHKGSVLNELSRLLNIPSHRVFAAGDNHNDLSMLKPEFASHLVCPSNAIPQVREAVENAGGFVARSPASRGVREGILHYASLLEGGR